MSKSTNRSRKPHSNGHEDYDVADPPNDLFAGLDADIEQAGGELQEDPRRADSIGATMFDLPGSEDNSITVLLPKDQAQKAPSQSLVRIKSLTDSRNYLGMVTAGPFAEPDTLRADSRLLVTVTSMGGIFLPPFHGRIHVTILGEELEDGTLVPPRLRPLPNSPVFVLDDKESASVLNCEGDMRLGLVEGYENIPVGIPPEKKSVLPRHTAVLGTTGGGKSTTVAGLIQQAQQAGMAVILLDVEGEYTFLHEPNPDARMRTALQKRNLGTEPIPAEQITLYHLYKRESTNPDHPHAKEFTLQFARMSPFAAMEILELSDAQQQRYLKAYDITKEVMLDLGIFPAKKNAEQERLAMEIDEFERGYPRMTLSLLIDVATACMHKADKSVKESGKSRRSTSEEKEEESGFKPHNKTLASEAGLQSLRKKLNSMNPPGDGRSWRALLGKLWRLQRIKAFYDEAGGVKPVNYSEMLQPGRVSLVDLSDTGASELNNLVISDLLRGVQEAQEEIYANYEKAKANNPDEKPPQVLLVIEEAHEFLSTERIDKMQILFEQVSRIAKRGRKRWLSLAFVTQLPQHLPRQIFGLVNNFVLHKINDTQVVSMLRKTIGGIDDSLWNRLPTLAPGQAIVSFGHMTRPLMVSIDPTPCKLRMVD